MWFKKRTSAAGYYGYHGYRAAQQRLPLGRDIFYKNTLFKSFHLKNISRDPKFDSFNFLEKIAFVFLTADSADFKHC